MRANAGVSEWYRLIDEADVPSPSLLIFLERVEENLRRMVEMAGDAGRLRPHVKTHKLPQVVAMQLRAGITKFKAATIAETELCAAAGVPEVLLASPLVGPHVARLVELVRRFPGTRFLALADDAEAVAALGRSARDAGLEIEVLVDLNVGMNRTGIAPGEEAMALYRRIDSTPGLRAGGLHAYDGHLHQEGTEQREAAAASAFGPVWTLREQILAAGLEVPRTVVGGSPTFQILSRVPGVELGAGTPVFWDSGYAGKYPELEFLEAAVLLTRVISRPTPTRLTLDLGHKAVASEMPQPRVRLLGLEEATAVMHSEEHLVLETPRAPEYPVGTVLYGIPRHVCPTVALHSEVLVVRDHRVQEVWPVVGRARRLTV